MPYATNQGIKIHYEVEGTGTPLVLQHGFSGSLESWKLNGYADNLKNHYRVILVDARGHGKSDKPHDPKNYSYELAASDVIAVLDGLEISHSHYWGYSMGGDIGFALAKYFPKRFASFIIGGTSPYKIDPAFIDQAIALFRKGIEAVVAAREKENPMSPEMKAIRLANDIDAMIAMYEAAKNENGFEDILPSMTMPCLLYAGSADPVYELTKKCANQIPNVIFLPVPNANHATAHGNDLVLSKAKEFLEKTN